MEEFHLVIPRDIYEDAKRIAGIRAQPVESLLVDRLRWFKELQLPEEDEREFARLYGLPDNDLIIMSDQMLDPDAQAELDELMVKNSDGVITDEEYRRLEALISQGDRVTLIKSMAIAILRERGYDLDTIDKN